MKTNIPFLLNVIDAPRVPRRRLHDPVPRRDARAVPASRSAQDRATQAADATAPRSPSTASPASRSRPTTSRCPSPRRRRIDRTAPIRRRHRASVLKALGPEAFAQWVREQKPLLLTDTTFRDAHQSLLATRVRTRDMLRVADAYARLCPEHLLDRDVGRRHVRHVACGSSRKTRGTAWRSSARRSPTSSSRCCCAARTPSATRAIPTTSSRRSSRSRPPPGIDLFRVFDSLNWVPNMEVALEAVREAGALCEAAICYTGDILDPDRPKYNLKYYVEHGQGAGEARREPDRDQGHGRPLQAVRRRAADQDAPRGGRHPDPLPHPRHRRRPGRERPARRPRSASTSPTARSPRCRA